MGSIEVRLRRIVIFIVAMIATTTAAQAEIKMCANASGVKECICIWWASTTTVEVRCPDGSQDVVLPPSAYPIPSTWGGTGSRPAATPVPGGTIVDATVSNKLQIAKSNAATKLKGEWDSELLRFEPDECTELFDSSPLGISGKGLLSSYVTFRSGTNLQDSKGNVPCNDPNVALWTVCCEHSPYIFICDSFKNHTTSSATALLIHELMHIGGQTEDKNGTIGAGDPPNTSQITAAVRSACGL
jgi:hypothetical protein